jgi:hypothetical protein
MELSFNAIANLLLGLLAIPVSAGEKMYLHTHKGTTAGGNTTVLDFHASN